VFEGVFTALVTPFRDGGIDEPALHELIERQVDAGVDGVVPCGSTGEAATLSHEEHRRVVELTVAAVRGRVQVLAGTGSNSTRESIALTRHAREAGADGALLISPYYNKPTQEGIVAHYAAVAREGGLPILVYNIPGRTASNILPATMARLAELDGVVGVKEACGDLAQISRVVALCPDGFSVLSGDDALILPVMAVGGRGVISTTSNVAPRAVVELVDAARRGELARARALHLGLLPLFDALFCETTPIPVKAALAMQGLVDEELRLPLLPLSAASRERVRGALKDQGLLG
jgi:4-hydroxy-tetrahydrodipicolinate synthase